MTNTMRTWAMVAACWGALGCDGNGPTAGGETHFLDTCEETCAEGLTCVCGVCTMECDDDAACSAMGAGATCAGMNAYACKSDMPRFCEQSCASDADCGSMGGGFRCVDSACRQGGDVHAMAPKEKPFVMLLVDTSGSMERLAECECTTLECTECLPTCGKKSERNRWANVVESLTGSWSDEDFRCERMERTTDNGATYDRNYHLPYNKPPIAAPQAEDGVLDLNRTKLRFGLATFDGLKTYQGASDLIEMSFFDESISLSRDGLWSHGSVRPVHFPGCQGSYAINSGIRGPQAEEGALVAGLGPGEMLKANDQIQSSLLRTRPYGGTPIAAALDDLRTYLETVPAELGRSLDPARDRILLITDGKPDDDYRLLGCDCTQNTDPNADGYCGNSAFNDPAAMLCPYPTAEQAAEALRGMVQVEVIAFALDTDATGEFAETGAEALAAMEAVAAAGGDQPLIRAKNGAELREVLMARMEAIAR